MWVSHGTCSYICAYINTVENSVMLQVYLGHDFYNMIFKMKHKIYIYIYIYIALGSAPHAPPSEKFWDVPCCFIISKPMPHLLFCYICNIRCMMKQTVCKCRHMVDIYSMVVSARSLKTHFNTENICIFSTRCV